jgi:hypothetical protein
MSASGTIAGVRTTIGTWLSSTKPDHASELVGAAGFEPATARGQSGSALILPSTSNNSGGAGIHSHWNHSPRPGFVSQDV